MAFPDHAAVPDYGIDAPGIRCGMLLGGASGITVAAVAWQVLAPGLLRTVSVVVGALITAYGVGMGASMTWASRVGKLRRREWLLDEVGRRRRGGVWSGTEQVLDVGCGRGLLVIGAARRLRTGVATGVDVWRDEDQADNTPDAPRENARREGVAERIRIETADACALPFADNSMDVVLSHWVVHNLETADRRERALQEMWRVLRDDGVLALTDIEHVAGYADIVRGLGASDVTFDDGGWEARIMGALSGGTYRPQSIIATKRLPACVAETA